MIEREPQFMGRKYTARETLKATEAMQSWKEEALEPIEGEHEKTDFDLKIINTAKVLLADELRTAGMEMPEIKTQQIHVFDGSSYRARFSRNDSGFMRSTDGAICINLENSDSSARYLATLLHELIHTVSTHKFYMDPQRNVYDARVGYHLRSMWKKDRIKDMFLGLNEFMTDVIAYMTLLRNAEKLEKEFGVSLEDINGPMYSYMEHGKTINAIINSIATYRGEDSWKVLGGFSRGLFENTILKLKDVEKVFGKGSLRILSSLGSLKDEAKDEQNRKLVEEFFTTGDGQKREELREEILRGIKILTSVPRQ